MSTKHLALHTKTYTIVLTLAVLLTGCSSFSGSNANRTVEVVSLTEPRQPLEASINNPQNTGTSTTIGTIDPTVPLIAIESNDGLPPDSEALLDLPDDTNKSLHLVTQGETLYSLSKRYNKDLESLAILNELDSNYTIYPGQQLKLNGADIQPSTALAITAKPQTKTTPTPSQPKVYNTQKTAIKDGLSWIWPVSTTPKVLRSFSDKNGETIKGIEISGKKGDPVLAASNGIVVYAGDELTGYGNLVIISHGERFISAYAHNDSILVKEEQKIKQGQRIALIGSSGADQVKLFFQIRKESNPVDPIIYLPKR